MILGPDSTLASLYRKVFADREIFVRSNGSVRYVTLSGRVQALTALALVGLVAWASVFTVRAFVFDTEIAYRDHAINEVRDAYEERVLRLRDRYDRLQAELEDSERRFDQVVRQLSGKHGQLESATGVQLAIEGQLDATRRRLRDVTAQRDESLSNLEELRLRALELERRFTDAQLAARQSQENLTDFVSTLDATTSERDEARRHVRELSSEVTQLNTDVEDIRRHQEQVMAQIEDATRASIIELERILKKSGVDVDGLVKEIERTYSGEGGPFIPVAYRVPDAASDFPLSEDSVLSLLDGLQRVNSLKLALEKMPLAKPLKASYRHTSGFGPRRHPIKGTWAVHNGLDMAAPGGTPVYAPVEGVVKFSGVQRGYGNVVKVLHSLGYETVYAHMSKIHVAKGDRVERGTLVGEVGSTGRSTGDHLHYEIRRYGKPLNPRRFIEAGRNVF